MELILSVEVVNHAWLEETLGIECFTRHLGNNITVTKQQDWQVDATEINPNIAKLCRDPRTCSRPKKKSLSKKE